MRDALNKQPIDMGDEPAGFAAAHVPERDKRTFQFVRLCPRLPRFNMLVIKSRNCILSATLRRAYHEHTTPSAKPEARAHSGTS